MNRLVRSAIERTRAHLSRAYAEIDPVTRPIFTRAGAIFENRLLREAVRNLLGARQRTILALLGILIGTGSVIAMINIGAIVQAEALRDFLAMGTDIFTVNANGTRSKLTMQDIDDLAASRGALRSLAPVVTGSSGRISFDGREARGGIVASSNAFWSIAKLRATEGRLLSDFDRLEPFAVVGAKVRQEMADKGRVPQIRDEIRIDKYIFTIVGFVDAPPANALIPVEPGDTIFISLPNMRRVSPGSGLDQLVGRSAVGATTDQVRDQISQFILARHPDLDVTVNTAAQLIKSMEKQMRLYTLLLGAVGSIALVVGGVGVMNVMLVSVTERRREIGIRMAIGARGASIRAMFLSEALVLSLVGGALGTILGISASALMASLSGWHFLLAKLAIPLGVGISAAVGIFFGYYPAVQASKMNPIDALRSE